MAGASVAMTASALLKHGPAYAKTAFFPKWNSWMEEHEYVSVNQMIGSMSQRAVADPACVRTSELHEGTEFVLR